MSTVQVRMDKKTKQSAKKVLDSLGIDMSSAINVYFKQIIIHQGIPFQLLTENGFTLEEEDRILKASEDAEARKNLIGPFSGKEAVRYLKSIRK